MVNTCIIMLKGETRKVVVTFNTGIVADLNAGTVTELRALLYIGSRPMLKFRKDLAVGYDGFIEVDNSVLNRCSFNITEGLSNKLKDGEVFLEVWLKQTISAVVTNRSFKVKLMEVGLINSLSESTDELTVLVENESINVNVGDPDPSFTETDPTVPSHVKNISTNDIAGWDAKATAAALTTETNTRISEDLLKVDKVAGKQLSTQDYSTTEKNKLAAISGTNTGDETTSTILNKIGDGSKINSSYLPSFVDDVIEVASFAALPVTGETGKIYVTINTNFEYRWSGSIYVRIVASPGSTDEVAEGSGNKYFSEARVKATVLTSIDTAATDSTVQSTDSVFIALGKLQGQITKQKNDFDDDVRSTPLTGLDLNQELNAVNEDNDVFTAIQKLQVQLEHLFFKSQVFQLKPNVEADGILTKFEFTLPDGWPGTLQDHNVKLYADCDFGGYVVTPISNAGISFFTISGNEISLGGVSVAPNVLYIDLFRNFSVTI